MATEADIARLRLMVGEPDDTEPWTDSVLSELIDGAIDLNTAAMEVWEAKAASTASMVDTTESGSTRRMSQLNDQALKMLAYYRKLTEPDPETADLDGRSYVVPIERV